MILNKVHAFRTSITFDLLDAGNVVYHPNYLVLCERARNAGLMAAGYSFREMWTQGLALAVVEVRSKYSRALELDQDIVILTLTTGTSGTRLFIHQDIILSSRLDSKSLETGFDYQTLKLEKKEILYEVDYTLACVKLNPLKSCRFPEALVSALELQSISKTLA
jgi:YbgC/YbaW family acyl-CoA thioester hydrolase